MPDLSAQLTAAAERVRGHEAAGRRATGLLAAIRAEQDEVARLAREAGAEQGDVDRLEGLALTRVLAGLTRSRQQRLGTERAQAQAAALRLAQAQARLDALARAHDLSRSRAARLDQVRTELADLLREQERRLAGSGDARAVRLGELAAECGVLRADLTETEEADAAAVAAIGALDRVLDRLGSAQGWATYDVIAGGMVAGVVKHSRLDEAADAAADADRRLAVLHRELADLHAGGGSAERLPAVGGLLRFADIWLDDFFADLAVRRRILDSRRSVDRARGSVLNLRRRLGQRKQELGRRLAAVDQERGRLLTEP